MVNPPVSFESTVKQVHHLLVVGHVNVLEGSPSRLGWQSRVGNGRPLLHALPAQSLSTGVIDITNYHISAIAAAKFH